MATIQSASQVANSNAQSIASAASELPESTVTEDLQTNITAKGKAMTAFATAQVKKSEYKAALEQDAQRITELGEVFEELDTAIADILGSGQI